MLITGINTVKKITQSFESFVAFTFQVKDSSFAYKRVKKDVSSA